MGRPVPFTFRESAFGTQYSEVKQRALAAGPLLKGTPGFLKTKGIHGSDQVYRIYNDGASVRREEYVAPAADTDRVATMQARIEEARWIQEQVGLLRRLGFQVAEKAVADVLVAFHNQQAFDAGLVLVGTLAVMSWINEIGLQTGASMTRDIDFARGRHLKFGTPVSFVETVRSTGLGFTPIPGMPSHVPSTSMSRPGRAGLKVDMLAPGDVLGRTVSIPELQWTADTIPHYDWMLATTDRTTVLAGGHCIPVRVPEAARLAMHKFYSSTQRHALQDKAAKDRQQATALTAALADWNPEALGSAYRSMPEAMRDLVDPVVDRADFAFAAPVVEEVLTNARRHADGIARRQV